MLDPMDFSNQMPWIAQSGGTIALDASYKKLYTYFTSVVEFGEFSEYFGND